MSKRSIVHIEIAAAVPEDAARFYADAFGWETSHTTEPMPYTGFMSGSVGGGFPGTGDQYKPGDVILYIESEDVAADLALVEKHGGKKLSDPFRIGDFGEMAFFTDPTGNRLAFWKDLGGAQQS